MNFSYNGVHSRMFSEIVFQHVVKSEEKADEWSLSFQNLQNMKK